MLASNAWKYQAFISACSSCTLSCTRMLVLCEIQRANTVRYCSLIVWPCLDNIPTSDHATTHHDLPWWLACPRHVREIHESHTSQRMTFSSLTIWRSAISIQVKLPQLNLPQPAYLVPGDHFNIRKLDKWTDSKLYKHERIKWFSKTL